ncbi:AAA family ATPase [bacterium]|nr:AAA family ATPase [bacterium]
MSIIDLSKDQKHVISELLEWQKDGYSSQYITVGGFAGTGKTTLIAELKNKLNDTKKKRSIGFAAYTGKAARVLKLKLHKLGVIDKTDSVGTIHSLMYSPIEDKNGEISGWQKKDNISKDLIIVDEASMIDGQIWSDLLSYNIPIIAVGDHGQLPPVKGSFNLMQDPDLKLEEIHRQEQDNPIIKISILARKFGIIPEKEYAKNIVKISKKSPYYNDTVNKLLGEYNKKTLVICGFNHTRVKLNNRIREKLGIDFEKPQIGDRVICLRNNHKNDIFNGMLGTLLFIENKEKDWLKADIKMDGEKGEYNGNIYIPQFNNTEPLNFTKFRNKTLKGDLFDFGYALTVHKAQGSQAKRVVLFEERFSRMTDEEWRRWLYTAVTRAQEELFIV